MSDSSEAKWYVVHTYSGYENKVASDLATMVESRGMQDLIQDIKIPTETRKSLVSVGFLSIRTRCSMPFYLFSVFRKAFSTEEQELSDLLQVRFSYLLPFLSIITDII